MKTPPAPLPPAPSPLRSEGEVGQNALGSTGDAWFPAPRSGEGLGEGTSENTSAPLRSEGEAGQNALGSTGDARFPAPRSGEGLGEGTSENVLYTRTTLEVWDTIKPFARQMRQEPTAAEEALWQQLRRKHLDGYKFRRQHPIDRFIVDFFCREARLVIEVDGAIHDYTAEEDALRTEFLASRGLRVMSFTNEAVLQHMDGVLDAVREALTNLRT